MQLIQSIRQLAQSQAWFTVLLAFFLYLLCTMVLMGTFMLTMTEGIGIDLQAILTGAWDQSPNAKGIFQLTQFFNQAFTWGAAAFLTALVLGNPKKELALSAPKSSFPFGPLIISILAALILVVSMPLVEACTLRPDQVSLPDWLKDWEFQMKQNEERTQMILGRLFLDESWGMLLVNLVVFALMPAICEELFFRGVIQNQLSKRFSPQLAIILTGFVFSAVHFQIYGLFSRALLGILLGFFVYQSGSLIPGIVAHFCFNGIQVIGAFVAAQSGSVSVEELFEPSAQSVGMLSVSAGLMGLLLFLFIRTTSKLDQDL
ncbi:CPBP family intramembrane glutamic endopeptidase [Pontibacter sp. G13]|uniref:CPBP family intramembrane glutamic endopeptidase n=1 Tax=Pontibacter sp. G13 TaxID=3074898 RepID=UPI00288B2463|nr:CPBP family intramembrane glutamic endopeptidase [Pontibacter sp. G13]WNJ16055.1 CPBP family intramembrane glutamic endopeptidase [Pontibacter sp. G13]